MNAVETLHDLKDGFGLINANLKIRWRRVVNQKRDTALNDRYLPANNEHRSDTRLRDACLALGLKAETRGELGDGQGFVQNDDMRGYHLDMFHLTENIVQFETLGRIPHEPDSLFKTIGAHEHELHLARKFLLLGRNRRRPNFTQRCAVSDTRNLD